MTVILGVGFLTTIALPASAVDTPVSGRVVKMKDSTQPGTARRKFGFQSRDLVISVPADGSGGDPSLNGGSLEILNSSGSGESSVVSLPAANWRRVPKNPEKALRGWKYKEKVHEPPTNDYKVYAAVKQNSSASAKALKAKIIDDRGNVLTYTLDEPTQGSIAVRLVTGSDEHCADFGGEIRRDEGEVLGDGVHRGAFSAKLAPAPANCAFGSPSGAFLDRLTGVLD